MRFVTFRRDRNARLGLLAGEQVIDLNSADADLPSNMLGFLEAGAPALERAAAVHQRWAEGQLASETAFPLAGLPLLAPIPDPAKVVAVGANYWDHCRECNLDPPEKPILFAKFPTSVIGPGQAIEWDPDLTTKVDYEAELAIVIGQRARAVPRAKAFDVIFGYTCGNDVSARDLQLGDGQWVRGKSLDTFCPLGPALVTRDEVPDPDKLAVACRVNGTTFQDSTTAEMIFDIPTLIEFITQAFTLLPGDVILTGTPHGTGGFREPNIFLGDGDTVEVEIKGLGVLRNPCRETPVMRSV
jgi:2-keto-4-pentenoate hydratase/2-oxohepta-3-ene-1,7-dioic acid hydratase in catechol pathway